MKTEPCRVNVQNQRGKDEKSEEGNTMRIRLAARAIYRLEGDRRGEVITSHTGITWVTQEGDPEDHLVAAGESFAVDRPGRVVIQALREASITVGETWAPASGPAPRRAAMGDAAGVPVLR